LEAHRFEEFVELQFARFYAEMMGHPSLAPGHTSACCTAAVARIAQTLANARSKAGT
jgi:hypothetical protein